VSLSAGSKIGPYEIVGVLGAGGMGEVYRARDMRLKREVALKILPASFASDPDRLARFQREAEVLASLNHPNIAAIYGFEEAAAATGSEHAAIRALVMELVDGETLAERIARGAIPIDEALPLAKQIAEALEAAHEQGIIHRDLKPANIKLRPDGTVKVLDFGLAKLSEANALNSPHVSNEPNALSMSPTITSPAMTAVGVLLGTAAYMSPEQAKGKPADKRSDIWAFGCVLYEMLTGRRAFAGEDVSDTLATVLRGHPEWTVLPADTPTAVHRLLRRCLERDRRHRLADVADAQLELRDALSVQERDRAAATASRPERLAWAAALVLCTAVAAMLAWVLRPVPITPEMRLEIATPPTADVGSLAISPNGQKVVFAARTQGRPQLWLRSLDSADARPLAGTDLGTLPFWSPDSRSIGFFADGKLKRVDIDGSSPQVLADAGLGMGGAWHPDGTILFVPRAGSPVLRLSAGAGAPAAVTKFDVRHVAHRHPRFLPDGRHFLYYVVGAPEVSGVYVGQIDGSESKRLLDSEAAAVYAASGQLLFVRQGVVYAQDFDLSRLALTGEPFLVADGIAIGLMQSAALSASASGPIVYRTGSVVSQRQFVWFDRSGKEVGNVGTLDPADPRDPSVSPDGSRVAMTRTTAGSSKIWILDSVRGVLDPLTSNDLGTSLFPSWSPDGSHIAFSFTPKNSDVFGSDLYQVRTTDPAHAERLYGSPGPDNPTDWSPDGRFLLFRQTTDIWALPLTGDKKAFPVVATDAAERDGQFAPNGQWIAYQSDESGQFEIYLAQFPGGGGKRRVSTNGGAQVRWRADGAELFYIGLDDRLMSVPVKFNASGEVEIGSPTPLFATRIGGAVQAVVRQQYIVSRDGQRFLMNTVPEQRMAPITVIVNWKAKP
jgi:Tol biopolymer transport system component